LKTTYHTVIFLYTLGIRIASLFQKKAALWVRGRRQKITLDGTWEGPTMWMHCASLGEFEQGRPVLEAIKKERPDTRIVLTFFSPSGFEVRKNYPGADAVFYLPADLPGNAARFFDSVNPAYAIFVKYEFWQGYLHEAKKRGVPLYLISGIFRKEMPFFRWYGTFFREGLDAFRHLFVQDESSKELLAKIGYEQVTVCGDTRLDRVVEAAAMVEPLSEIGAFKGENLLWVCGSTWPADDEKIAAVLKRFAKRPKTLLVPHDIRPDYLRQFMRRHPELRMRLFSEGVAPDADLLILDRMGLLMRAYAHADFAYVGGGFGHAVHNTMEPAAYGIPVAFGPRHQKFNEIGGLLSCGGGICLLKDADFETYLRTMTENETLRKKMGEACRNYVKNNSGATKKIMAKIFNLNY
jgi:3-deoxy-D-manno-octulosonic-acid transferase